MALPTDLYRVMLRIRRFEEAVARIVGAGLPIAVGAALAATLEGGDRVAAAFEMGAPDSLSVCGARAAHLPGVTGWASKRWVGWCATILDPGGPRRMWVRRFRRWKSWTSCSSCSPVEASART